ncbi:DUF4352 domain-containing protein [Brevibacterium sp. UCMA 11754]|nr:DUF4352 domain-containing protein [Brevibacterium sp. UCMA 11754]
MADPQASGYPGAGHPSAGPAGASGYGGPGGYDSGAFGQGAYGPGGYGPGAYGPGSSGQRPPKRRKPLLKRWWFWIVLILVVVIIGSAISGGGDDSAENTESSAAVAEDEAASGDKAKEEPAADKAAEEDAAASYGIGDVVAADDWEVTVNSVKDGVSSVGDEYLGAEAQGQFVTVNLSVKNTASAPDFFWEDNIKLGDEAGNTYSADSEAGLYADADSILFAEEINPGNTAKGVLVFDVPADVSPDKLTFEGGLFADPIEISLG